MESSEIIKLTETKTDMQCERRREKDSFGQICTGSETVKTNNSVLLPTSKGLLQMSGQLDIRPAPASESGLSAFLVLSAALKS